MAATVGVSDVEVGVDVLVDVAVGVKVGVDVGSSTVAVAVGVSGVDVGVSGVEVGVSGVEVGVSGVEVGSSGVTVGVMVCLSPPASAVDCDPGVTLMATSTRPAMNRAAARSLAGLPPKVGLCCMSSPLLTL
jgi:hypothetical protein